MIAIPITETLHATIQVLRTLRELEPSFKFEDEGRIDRLFGVGYSVGIPCLRLLHHYHSLQRFMLEVSGVISQIFIISTIPPKGSRTEPRYNCSILCGIGPTMGQVPRRVPVPL